MSLREKMKITKDTINTLKSGDILEGWFNGKKRCEVITLTYEISDVAAKVTGQPKTQHYFQGITKKGTPDMRTKSVDVLNSFLEWYKK